MTQGCSNVPKTVEACLNAKTGVSSVSLMLLQPRVQKFNIKKFEILVKMTTPKMYLFIFILENMVGKWRDSLIAGTSVETTFLNHFLLKYVERLGDFV